MRILGIKPGHDGTLALIEDGVLKYSFEAEKNSFPRFSHITPSCLLDAAALCGSVPDCIALSGWNRAHGSDEPNVGMGYWGVGREDQRISDTSFFGQQVKLFEGTHESSHIWCAYGMSPFAGTYPCHVLIWEGWIGRFYRIDRSGVVTSYPQILEGPGSKYAFIFMLADPTYIEGSTPFRFDDAGKLMALVSYGEERSPTEEERSLVEWILGQDGIMRRRPKTDLAASPFLNVGVTSQRFADLARAHSNAIFDLFARWAEKNLECGLPLVIGGGCGLNCNWNTSWMRSGLFSDVFVPPCANDTGSAIGTAVQAQLFLTHSASIEWNVYCGSPQKSRCKDLAGSGVEFCPAKVDQIASDLAAGHVVAIMRGPCEIGPRALGARSLLADPRSKAMLTRLNAVKQREEYRPIAPICTAEAADAFFDMPKRDKFMLFFSLVRDGRVPAVTHVDNSARVQVVGRDDNPFIWSLVRAFGERTGVPVLCNTSLNFKGKGFIDEVDDLIHFCRERGIDRAVCEDHYIRLP
jgi:predicted NodU family carbamoyl transferase